MFKAFSFFAPHNTSRICPSLRDPTIQSSIPGVDDGQAAMGMPYR